MTNCPETSRRRSRSSASTLPNGTACRHSLIAEQRPSRRGPSPRRRSSRPALREISIASKCACRDSHRAAIPSRSRSPTGKRRSRPSKEEEMNFGRQPQKVTVKFEGELEDITYWIRELARRAEFKGDLVDQFGDRFVIYPRAVND